MASAPMPWRLRRFVVGASGGIGHRECIARSLSRLILSSGSLAMVREGYAATEPGSARSETTRIAQRRQRMDYLRRGGSVSGVNDTLRGGGFVEGICERCQTSSSHLYGDYGESS